MVKSSCLSVTVTASAERPLLNHRVRGCDPAALVLHNPYSTLLSVTGLQWQVRDSLSFSGTEGCPEGFFCFIRGSLGTEVKNSSSDAKIPRENKWNLSLPASVITTNQNALHSQNTQLTSSLHINLAPLLKVIIKIWLEILRALSNL